jgi:hypothetical protein
MKSVVYSWRLAPELKTDLERAGRRQRLRLAEVIDIAAREWLAKNAYAVADDEEQKRLHAKAERYIGVIRGRDPRRSERVTELVKKSLERKYGRR